MHHNQNTAVAKRYGKLRVVCGYCWAVGSGAVQYNQVRGRRLAPFDNTPYKCQWDPVPVKPCELIRVPNPAPLIKVREL